MAFEKREEFFVPGRTAEVARADGWQALIMHGIGGLFFLSLWFWMDGSGPVQVGHEIYQGMFLFSPLIGLFVLGRGVLTALAYFREAKEPITAKLAYAVDGSGLHLHDREAAALMPWSTILDLATSSDASARLTLVHRPERGKVDERRVVNGAAKTSDGTDLAQRLPLWRAAMAKS